MNVQPTVFRKFHFVPDRSPALCQPLSNLLVDYISQGQAGKFKFWCFKNIEEIDYWLYLRGSATIGDLSTPFHPDSHDKIGFASFVVF